MQDSDLGWNKFFENNYRILIFGHELLAPPVNSNQDEFQLLVLYKYYWIVMLVALLFACLVDRIFLCYFS